MLRKLHIQNYALIDHLEIDFQRGLNTITGETGAGKSILIGALALILGQRADTSVLKDNAKSCIVEGEFDVSDYDLEQFFARNDIDPDKTTIIRRQITDSGKSRAFINETPVNLSQLKELGDLLIDIHSQHENLLLGSSLFQLRVIDAFASLKSDVLAYRNRFNAYRELRQQLAKLEDDAQNAARDTDYLKHQLAELASANLKANELAELETLQKQLTHASNIKETLQLCHETLNSDTASVLTMLRTAGQSLKRIAQVYPPADDIERRVESCRVEVKDIAEELGALGSQVEVDDELLDKVSKRIDLIYTLLQKHRVASMEELIALRSSMEERAAHLASLDFSLESLRHELAQAEQVLTGMATELSDRRKKAIPQAEQSVTELLVQLGMPHAVFRVDIQPLPEFQPFGTDRITFFFTANKQVAPMELSRVASGGELSRLMLSLKSLLVRSSGLPTIIFDEIDTGVSGEIADKMGTIIHSMADGMQVINITHLPQIAAKGQTHFLVYKDTSSAQSATRIKLLAPHERITEIAKMLSGERITDAALSNAKELLS